MLRRVTRGMAAGAVGTFALDTASYLDMLVRGRPASELPARAAGQLADQAGVDLGEGDEADNRRTALGALLGYATGATVGALYALSRGRRRRVPWPVAGVAVGGVALVASAVPLTKLGLTDPKEWGTAGWISDIVPHAAYGFATALAYEAIAG
jgi:hypothetical protein